MLSSNKNTLGQSWEFQLPKDSQKSNTSFFFFSKFTLCEQQEIDKYYVN